MISTEKILRAICILQIFGSARESAVASCNFLFLHLAFCIFLQIDAALIWNLQNINFAFCVYKEDFYWAVSIMEQNLNCDPWRAICKNSILHFASCNFLQYYQLASLQGAKTRSCILHFAFFCKFAISQKLSANIDFLQFARSFCIFSQFCKKVMISKYPPLDSTKVIQKLNRPDWTFLEEAFLPCYFKTCASRLPLALERAFAASSSRASSSRCSTCAVLLSWKCLVLQAPSSVGWSFRW